MENILMKVINLDRRPDRLELFYNNIKKLDSDLDITKIERFSAIDGQILLEDIKNKGYQDDIIFEYLRNNKKYAKGELACLLSHYFLLKKISQDDTIKDYQIVFIFEDDVFVNEEYIAKNSFKDIVKELLIFNSKFDWDLLYMGGIHDIKNYIPRKIDSYEKLYNNFYERNECLFNSIFCNITTHVLIINKKSANKIINSLLDFLKNNMGNKQVHTIYDTIITLYLKNIKKIDYVPYYFYSLSNYLTDIQGHQNRNKTILGKNIVFN